MESVHLPLVRIEIAGFAFLYSSVGDAGASGYIHVMTLCGLAAPFIQPTALVLNIFVACISTFFSSGAPNICPRDGIRFRQSPPRPAPAVHRHHPDDDGAFHYNAGISEPSNAKGLVETAAQCPEIHIVRQARGTLSPVVRPHTANV